MRDYELVALINPEVDQEGLAKVIDRISQCISSKGGVVRNVDRWGRRKLAYPIKKFMEADYVLTRFELPPNVVKELQKEIAMAGEILRYLVVKVEERDGRTKQSNTSG
jgi:small subunit ribosomal protein S6